MEAWDCIHCCNTGSYQSANGDYMDCSRCHERRVYNVTKNGAVHTSTYSAYRAYSLRALLASKGYNSTVQMRYFK